jgi:hypothetical protein
MPPDSDVLGTTVVIGKAPFQYLYFFGIPPGLILDSDDPESDLDHDLLLSHDEYDSSDAERDLDFRSDSSEPDPDPEPDFENE